MQNLVIFGVFFSFLLLEVIKILVHWGIGHTCTVWPGPFASTALCQGSSVPRRGAASRAGAARRSAAAGPFPLHQRSHSLPTALPAPSHSTATSRAQQRCLSVCQEVEFSAPRGGRWFLRFAWGEADKDQLLFAVIIKIQGWRSCCWLFRIKTALMRLVSLKAVKNGLVSRSFTYFVMAHFRFVSSASLICNQVSNCMYPKCSELNI